MVSSNNKKAPPAGGRRGGGGAAEKLFSTDVSCKGGARLQQPEPVVIVVVRVTRGSGKSRGATSYIALLLFLFLP